MTAPSSKQLGQTTDPQELVPGDVEHIEANVTRLESEHKRINGLFDSLKAVRVPEWSGVAQQAWEVHYDAEVDRWKKYLEHLTVTKGATSEKNGLAVVAPIKEITPASTSGSSTSCWARLKRWSSSMNRTVFTPPV